MANQRILATEEMVGYAHATKADTLNRLVMVEHDEAGVHGATAKASMGVDIPAGTKMLFYANTAPTGWTLDNTLDDKVVYVTKGSVAGGQTGGGAHSAGTWTQPSHQHTHAAFTLTANEMPAHTHTVTDHIKAGTGGYQLGGGSGALIDSSTGSAGSGAAHTHPNAAAAATANTWRPAAYAMIICSKN